MSQIIQFLIDQAKTIITLEPSFFLFYLVLPLAVLHAMYGKYSERKIARAKRLAIARAKYAESLKMHPVQTSNTRSS